MKTIRKHIIGLAIIGGLIGSLLFVHAQTVAQTIQSGAVSLDDPNVDWASLSDVEVELKAIEATTPVAADALPFAGTFISAQHALDWPPLPGNIRNLPCWPLDTNLFLLSDLAINYSAKPKAAQPMKAIAGNMMAMDLPAPGDGGDGGTNSYAPSGSGLTVDYGTNLWIANFALSPSNAVGTLSNSLADILYEIQTRQSLTSTDGWASAGFVYGSELTNWTALAMANVSLTNNAFFRIRSWQDDGSGLPIWWQMQYLGATGADPFSFDPSGDGFTLWQAFEAGYDPTVFNTPAAPQGLTVAYNASTSTANISWLPSSGSVTGYTVERVFGHWSGGTTVDFNFSSGTSGFVDNISSAKPDPFNGENYDVSYRVQARYASGNSSWSASVPLQQNNFSASIAAGMAGSAYVVTTLLPSDTTTLRMTLIDESAWEMYYIFGGDQPTNPTFGIPVTDPNAGQYLIPAADAVALGDASYRWYAQAVNANGNGGASTPCLNASVEDTLPYFDGRVQLKQNLIFLLREPNAIGPFAYEPVTDGYFGEYPFVGAPAGYACAGYYDAGTATNQLDNYRPFADNYLYRNFVFNSTNVDVNGSVTTGVAQGNVRGFICLGLFEEPAYGLPTFQFQPPTNSWTTLPGLLGTNQTRWLVSDPFEATPALGVETNNIYYDMAGIGVTYQYSGSSGVFFTLANNASNYFGLPFQSVEIAYQSSGNLETYTLTAGNSSPVLIAYNLYPQTAQPQFQTVEYDFWNPNTDLLPGRDWFSPTNMSRLMIMPIGSPINIAGYAKLAVLNGYSGVYGYLGQYFDQAYKTDANGNATTNTTGVLSPYGSFFATEPGPVALVTMPDVDTGTRGTCMVYCVSLVLDKNHDGTMDGSFNGPDATSQASPYRIWVNNGRTVPGNNGSLDQDLPVPPNHPEYANYFQGEITCPRDLENCFRLWICGVPQLPVGQGYAVTLSMSPVSGNPAINLFYSCETNGGTGYLTDTNIAATQTGSAYYDRALCTISNNQSYTLQMNSYGNLLYTHYLFEGAGIGEGQLTMTISQNGNTIAQTGVWLDLHDIKDFYEQVHTANIDTTPPSTKTSVLVKDKILPANPPEDQQVIVYVHGLNIGTWEYYADAETMFKRLYWQGYHGRFAAFRWPSPLFSWYPTGTNEISYFGFNNGEYISWHSGAALKAYIDDLHNRLSGYTVNLAVHSLGNVAANEAIREGAQVDNYALMQAAISAGAFDGSASLNYDYLASSASSSPDQNALGGYRNCFTNATRRVNFYNDDDFALYQGVVFGVMTHTWEGNQLDYRPDHSTTYAGWYYEFDGTNCFLNIRDGNGEILSTRTLTEDFEKKAYVARSRTKAVGAAGLAHTPNALTGGVISTNVSLQDINLGFIGGASFGNTRPEHSGEFTKPIQNAIPFYRVLLDQGFDIRPKL